MQKRRKVIIVTDGDRNAQKAVETAAHNIGGRCISKSAGNPTPISGKEIIKLITESKNDPVVIMVDDKGNRNTGAGELVIEEIYYNKEINIIGVIAVASNTGQVHGTKVDFSIDNTGKIAKDVVDKNGYATNKDLLKGDTVDILYNLNIHPIVGIGDPGKMEGKDDWLNGAPILTKAMEEIIKWDKEHYTDVQYKR